MAGRKVSLTLICGFLSAIAAMTAFSARAQTPPDPLPVATDVRLAGDEKETRIIFDLTKKIDVRAFTLANPYRVIVDIPQTVFRLPPKASDTGRGLVKAFRYGLVMLGGSRVVFDVAKPVRLEKVFVLESKDGQPARLVLDLTATDPDTFMRNLALDSRSQPALDVVKKIGQPAQAVNDPRPLIVLDPGHGGPDTGTRAVSGEMEKDVVLDFSNLLKTHLEKTGKYRVEMTRTEDMFIPLAGRVQFARQHQAALFLSIHADAVPKGEDVQGATVYTLGDTASDGEAARLAEAENKSDVIAGIDLSTEPGDVADILIDLAQRETRVFSHHFARTLIGEMKSAVRLHKNPMKSAGFRVLKAPDVPSVLVELGYMSNKQDTQLLMSDEWRSKTAHAIVLAVDAFFRTRIAGAEAGRAR